MGIHRNVIHPRFGNFVVLGTVATQAEVAEYSAPIDFNPCLECKLCVAACPVGAIADDGSFDFFACYTHNYRGPRPPISDQRHVTPWGWGFQRCGWSAIMGVINCC
jgi:epoxyqueuosine reductase QueG